MIETIPESAIRACTANASDELSAVLHIVLKEGELYKTLDLTPVYLLKTLSNEEGARIVVTSAEFLSRIFH